MLPSQKHLFSLPEEVTYLNGGYMSPLLKSTEAAGVKGISQKAMPFKITGADFFEPVVQLKALFAQLINTPDPARIAVVPSVSYGMASAAKNIKLKAGEEILLVDEQFPSNYYSWQKMAEQQGATIRIIKPPAHSTQRGQIWNEQILEAIQDKTALIAIGHIHWADGTKYDLEAIRQKSRRHGALLAIDGTQSIGALPFDQSVIQADIIVCAAYKWLLGPYGLGLAYYSEYFDQGSPIEENWINRLHSEDFSRLINYEAAYQPKAGRYSVGEQSQFIHLPMLIDSIQQLLDWTTAAIQGYCTQLSAPALDQLRELNCQVEQAEWRSAHLFGIRFGEEYDIEDLKQAFQQNQVFVSIRGNAIRVSPNVYNTTADFDKLIHCFKQVRKPKFI